MSRHDLYRASSIEAGRHPVERVPGFLDGSRGVVLDEDGKRVARFAIDDQRETPADPVYAVFEDRDLGWEPYLRAIEPGRHACVSLVWPDWWRLDGVLVTEREPTAAHESAPTRLGIRDSAADPLDRTMFRLEHPEL